ncbi:MAG: M14 family metallopeptidase [Salinivirgaceae bacterium]|nr:M14 family metallopeptidase [Salinivirgaceae bacterium]
MIKTLVSEDLPVYERLLIKKNVVGNGGKRICIVTGIHGDELEGQYVCYELLRRLQLQPNELHGQVEVYPAINPLGVDSVTRGIPTFDLDMNRIFPGSPNGHMIENVAHQVVEDLRGADLVIDIHSSNIYLYEMPQARISNIYADKLYPLADKLNLDFIWTHDAATVLEATIAHSLNSIGTPTVVVEMGIGMKITREYGDQLVDGILNLMSHMNVWTGTKPDAVSSPIDSKTGNVSFINASRSGIIISAVKHGTRVKKGDTICLLVSSLEGSIQEEVKSPVDGLVFTIRSYPVVYEGSLIARIFTESN